MVQYPLSNKQKTESADRLLSYHLISVEDSKQSYMKFLELCRDIHSTNVACSSEIFTKLSDHDVHWFRAADAEAHIPEILSDPPSSG